MEKSNNNFHDLAAARIEETNHKLRVAVLKANPLWSDIMRLHSAGISRATIARACGCNVSTVKRHLKKMKAVGLFEEA